jgi:ribosome-associated protein
MPTAEDEPFIRLADVLKLAGMTDSGGHAKTLIQGGAVLVNELVETRRGRKLRAGDRVTAQAQTIVVDDEMLRREPR